MENLIEILNLDRNFEISQGGSGGITEIFEIPDCRMCSHSVTYLDFSALFTIHVMQTVYAVLAIELVFLIQHLANDRRGLNESKRERERRLC